MTFDEVKDPRVERTRRHNLTDIIVIAILAAISGADDWPEIVAYGRTHDKWLVQLLGLRHGIPSQSTFQRVFGALDPDAFHRAFLAWTATLVESLGGKHVAIDGKTMRRSFTTAEKKDPRHIISAWVTDNHVVFGQVATDDKSNEITAIPKLLKMLDLTDATVSIDAMGCQKKIVKEILEGKGHYVLAVKDNQPTLARDVEDAFATAQIAQEELPSEWRFETSEKGHGRRELRRTTVLDVKDRLSDKQQDWSGLRSIILIESERSTGEKTSTESRYYISSLEPDAELLARRIRAHWAIENELHWTLDMAFDEDHSRIRCNNGADNFALLRKIALNLIKAEKSIKQGVRGKRKRAGWDDAYLLRVLQSNVPDPVPPKRAT